MIAATAPEFGTVDGTAEGALFVTLFAAVGLVLLWAANRLMKRAEELEAARCAEALDIDEG